MFITKVRAAAPGQEEGDRSPFWGDFFFKDLGRLVGGVRVTPSRALGLPAVFGCVKVLSESFAVLPFTMHRLDAKGKRKRIHAHPLIRLFRVAPNEFQSPFEWREMVQGHLALRGNAFNAVIRNGAGDVVSLLPLHPDRICMELLKNGSYRYRYLTSSGESVFYRRDEVWHLRGLSSDGYMGMSPIDEAREAIGEGLAMQSYATRFFGNDARPGGGWIENPARFASIEAKRKFRDAWQELQGGANQGKVAVLEAGMKYHEVGVTNEQAQFVEARARKPAEVCSIFRVPPHKIGDLSKATFSNIEEQNIEFWTDTMHPWAQRWESSIQAFLLGDPTLEVEFDMRGMMRGNSTARGAYYTSGINAGWLTRNEAREQEGLEPLDGLDKPLQPLNMGEAGRQPTATERVPSDPADDSKAAAGRLQSVLRANAVRMARRMKAGKPVPAEVLAEALGIDLATAAAWQPVASDSEEALVTALVALGNSRLGDEP